MPRGIFGTQGRIAWTQIKDLGEVADPVIARRLNVSVRAVSKARERLGIPAYTPPRKRWGVQFPESDLAELTKIVKGQARKHFWIEYPDACQEGYLAVIVAWPRLTKQPTNWQALCETIVARRLRDYWRKEKRHKR